MVTMKNVQAENRRIIVSAVRTYINTDFNLKKAALLFGVSENTLASWFCEAVSERYVSDDMCLSIKRKHVAEYEAANDIQNSYLRTMYDLAFAKRKIVATKTVPDAVTPTTA